ncbi:MAG: zinc metallopeptidase [Methylocystaceae bacterium]
MFFWDPTMIILIPAIILSFYAQMKVSSTFKKYSQVASISGRNGSQLARMLLDRAGLSQVRVEHIAGQLSDHYDPRDQVLRLSDSVYGSNSVAALGVAAHEVGHAIQHGQSYAPLILRNSIVPVVNFASMASFPLLLIGLFISRPLAILGVILFTAVVVFQLITLPVEFNASNRAVTLLSDGGYIYGDEISAVKKVLGAAALTYVAAALVSLLNLLRFLMILGFNRDE